MFTKKFWKDTAERVVGTVGAVAIPLFIGTRLDQVDYAEAAGLVGSAALVTLLKCLAASQIGTKGDPSLIK